MFSRHGVALVLGDRGLLILGASGSGKTTLALDLVGHWSRNGLHAALISDDQVLLRAISGRLVARVPPTIAGLAEARGFGVGRVTFEPSAVVDLVVGLVDPQAAPRYRNEASFVLEDAAVPLLRLPWRDRSATRLALCAWHEKAPFISGSPLP
jgi:serine kinase of HPr protein (carbohydrate metabolism regulator)